MRNITVTVSDETYRLARVWAAERDTSVSAVVQFLLQSLKGMPHAGRAFPIGGCRDAAHAVPSINPPAPSFPPESAAS
jgi:hypothetical protein